MDDFKFRAIDDESFIKHKTSWVSDMARGKMPMSYCLKKLHNHFKAIEEGEDMDHSGVPHEDKIAWWCRAIKFGLKYFPEFDDRK